MPCDGNKEFYGSTDKAAARYLHGIGTKKKRLNSVHLYLLLYNFCVINTFMILTLQNSNTWRYFCCTLSCLVFLFSLLPHVVQAKMAPLDCEAQEGVKSFLTSMIDKNSALIIREGRLLLVNTACSIITYNVVVTETLPPESTVKAGFLYYQGSTPLVFFRPPTDDLPIMYFGETETIPLVQAFPDLPTQSNEYPLYKLGNGQVSIFLDRGLQGQTERSIVKGWQDPKISGQLRIFSVVDYRRELQTHYQVMEDGKKKLLDGKIKKFQIPLTIPYYYGSEKRLINYNKIYIKNPQFSTKEQRF